jgi:hypothetical protein
MKQATKCHIYFQHIPAGTSTLHTHCFLLVASCCFFLLLAPCFLLLASCLLLLVCCFLIVVVANCSAARNQSTASQPIGQSRYTACHLPLLLLPLLPPCRCSGRSVAVALSTLVLLPHPPHQETPNNSTQYTYIYKQQHTSHIHAQILLK